MKKMGLFLAVFFFIIDAQQKISIIGCGYVGLTMAAVFANSNNNIICIDVDNNKITALNNKHLPIYEPGLADYLFSNPKNPNIIFSTDLDTTIGSNIYYICVPTPIDEKGDCDTTYLHAAFNAIIPMYEKNPTIICVKSTVTPGTLRSLQGILEEQQLHHISLIYNPEFMREGCALEDIYYKNPIVLGGQSPKAINHVQKFYHHILGGRAKFIITNFETAEIIKYAWNSFSAIRIAYINELADLCMKKNGSISKLIEAIALSEDLLPTASLKPGPGYGGSCFPKDTSSFKNLLVHEGFSSSLVQQAIQSNELHKQRVIQTILAHIPEHGTVTLLGLAFKANTNDIRCAPSIDIIKALLEHNIQIKAYDPKAISEMQRLFPSVKYCQCPYEAVINTDCIVVLTEWEQIKQLDLTKIAQLSKRKCLIDMRNLYNHQELKRCGFMFCDIGEAIS